MGAGLFRCEASERGGTTGMGVDVTASAVDATGLEAVAVDDGAALVVVPLMVH